MMQHNIYLYILVSGLVSYLIRVLPLTLIKKPIKTVFGQSFLYYVPYVTLAVMTFPAIIEATNSIYSGLFALIVGVILAWKEKGLLVVATCCCLAVFIIEFFI